MFVFPPFLFVLLLLPSVIATSLPQRTGRTGCCDGFGPGLTFDTCADIRQCAPGRHCLTADTLFPCPIGRICICYPVRVEPCSSSQQCIRGEICAARVYDHHPFCVSEHVVALDPSFKAVESCCDTEFPVTLPVVEKPHPDRPPTVTKPPRTPSVTPTPTRSPTPSPTPKRAVVTAPPPRPGGTPRPSRTSRPSRPPRPTRSARPRPTPTSTSKPSRKPRPSPSKSPRPRPSPSREPSITAVAPQPRPSPQPQRTRPPKTNGGLAGDDCRRQDDCLSYRKCIDRRTKRECTTGDCVCVGSRVCVCNDQCTNGELCSGAPGRAYCFSPLVIERLPWAQSLPCPMANPDSAATTPKPKPSNSGAGLTGSVCTTDRSCRGKRRCVVAGGDTCATEDVLCRGRLTPCAGSENCYCYQKEPCNCSNDCEQDEVCTTTVLGRICISPFLPEKDNLLQTITCPAGASADDPILIVNLVAPENLEESQDSSSSGDQQGGDEDEDEGVCVDARALKHLGAHELVFSTHRTARVLCDGNGSCATPGHVVLYQGTAMMMRSYCALVACTQQVMRVNSPKFKRAVRIPTNTDGLHFTAFAARYQTRFEELALTAIVHVGL